MKLDLKKIFFFAIVPALITGLFTIAPKLYEIASEQTTELLYSMVVGPEMQAQGGFQKIVAVTIQNSGKKTLSNVSGMLTIADGAFLSHEIQESNALKVAYSGDDKNLVTEVKKLHPSESFVISTLVQTSKQRGVLPEFGIRSDEALGTPQPLTTNTKSFETWKAPILATLITVLMTFVLLFQRLRASSVDNTSEAEPFDPDLTKHGTLYYVVTRLELENCLADWQQAGTLSYFHFADLMLSHGLRDKNEGKSRAISALKCLLLVKNMAVASRDTVIRNIKILEGASFNQANVDTVLAKAIDLDATQACPNTIRDLIDSQLNMTDC